VDDENIGMIQLSSKCSWFACYKFV
jgi:hypothetical protein